MAKFFVLESPNFCGLTYDSERSVLGAYVEAVPGAEVGAPDNFDEFFQFASKDACFEKALSIDPSYSKNNIYGPLNPQLVDSSPQQVVGTVNQAVTLFCEFSVPESGVTFSYQWKDPQGSDIPTATSNIFTFTPKSEAFAGDYTCVVTASGDHNWTGITSFICNVKLTPALSY